MSIRIFQTLKQLLPSAFFNECSKYLAQKQLSCDEVLVRLGSCGLLQQLRDTDKAVYDNLFDEKV